MGRERVIPILMYHKLGRPPHGARVPGHYVAPRLFRRQLAFLRARGYQSVPLTALLGDWSALPAKPFVVTFDDGYRCLYEHALPVLTELHCPATIFMATGGMARGNYWETAVGDVPEPMLSAAELGEMHRAGVAFGSHTVNHPHLTALSPAGVRREFADSRARLEEVLGAPCITLAYPYGDWNPAVHELAGEAGYRLACTTVRAAARVGDDRLALPRLNVRRYNLLPRFAYKLWQARRSAGGRGG